MSPEWVMSPRMIRADLGESAGRRLQDPRTLWAAAKIKVDSFRDDLEVETARSLSRAGR